MRIRLRILLPLVAGALVGVGFIVASFAVGDAVGGALTTVPGLTRQRAVVSAVRTVALTGALITVVAALAGLWVAQLIVRPLQRIQEATQRRSGAVDEPDADTVVAEIQDLSRGIGRAAGEISARHRRAHRERTELAALVEAVSEGILQVDGKGRIVRMNAATRVLLGLPSESAGRPVQSLLRSPELRDLMARGAGAAATETAEVMVDGRRILTSVAPQPDGGAVATFVDLTDLRRLEEVRRDFVANASHELKTPLTSIRGYTETLMSGDVPEAETRLFLGTISRNAERLQRIVDDLLDLSRLEAGRWQPELEPVHLIPAAERCWLAFADRAEEQGVSFSARTEGEDLALADRRAIEQVFTNLYDNALRYTSARDRIRVTTRPDREGPPDGAGRHGSAGPRPAGNESNGGARDPNPGGHPRWLLVEVSDTGTGIPRDALPRIFERFYRVDPARSRAEGGTGLGLSIVKHMVESMSGAIRAQSELGKGTTIRVWLPGG